MPLDPQAEKLLKKLADSRTQPFETMTLTGGNERAEILCQVNGLIAHELRPRPWLDGRQASLTHRFNGHTKNRHMAADPRIEVQGAWYSTTSSMMRASAV